MIATATTPPADSAAAPAEFAYRQRTFQRTDTVAMVDALHRDGFALIPGVLAPAEVAAARSEIDRLRHFHFDGHAKPPTPEHPDGNIDHWKCVFNRSPYWLQFADMAGVIELAEGTLGEQCHLIGMTAWRSNPQLVAPNTPYLNPHGIHSDHIMVPVKEELLLSGEVKMPVLLATAHYYLTDITIDLCPTWVVPGSHLSGKWAQHVPVEERTRFRGQEAQPVLCKAGDVLYFRSEVWHTGSKNRSDQTRYLLQVHYGNRFVCQKFSPYLDFRFNHEVVASANPRQRRLLGDHKPGSYD